MKKRLVALVCAVSLALLPGGALAAEPSGYGARAKNSALQYPLDDVIVMQNGTLVIEAEDMVYNQTMEVIDDPDASGGKALKDKNALWKNWATDVKNLAASPSYMTEILSDSMGTYYIWMRVKSEGQLSLWTTTDGKNYTARYCPQSEAKMTEYRWEKVNTTFQFYEGLMFVGFHYRNTCTAIDKLIITRDADFKPVGMNDVPTPIAPTENGVFPLPDIVPTNPHPRVLLNEEMIPQIKENVKTPALEAAYKIVSTTADERLNCRLEEEPNKDNYNNTLLEKIQMRAFMYAIGERDKQHARQTIAYLKDYIDTVKYNEKNVADTTFRERSHGMNIFTIGLVYDWCYDALTDVDKEYLIKKTKEFAAEHAVGYPPTKRLSISGHGTEDGIFRDYLTAGIALYDEDPELYNLSAGRILSEMRDAVELYTSSGAFANGNAYGMARYGSAIYAMKLFESMGTEKIFGEKFGDYSYKILYEKLPLGIWFKDSDDWYWTSYVPFMYNTNDTDTMMAGAYYGNPYAMRQLQLNMSINNYSGDMFDILFYAPIQEKEIDDLPLAYHTTYPFSSMVARTNWQSDPAGPTAMAKMSMNNINIGDHNHNDAGAFQFWYKGMLALQSGAYQAENAAWGTDAYWDYNVRSIAHNTLLIYDPNEKWYSGTSPKTLRTNDGGQRSQSENPVETYEDITSGKATRAVEKGWYIGPNEKTPEFSYISSDLTPAYNDPYTQKADDDPYTKKAEKYDRSMVFIDFFDEDYPAALVVYDRVESTNKDFKKTWLLHSQEEPTVQDNITTITRTDHGFSGKLVNTTLLPSSYTITKVGGPGKEFWVDNKNVSMGFKANTMADEGAWRIELSPQTASTSDTFLNVMYVTDNDKNLPQLVVQQISSTYSVGALIRDRVVTFATGYDKIEGVEQVTIPDTGFGEYSCLMNDMDAGVWKITAPDGGVVYTEVTEGNYSLYFKGVPGTYTVEKAPAGTAATQITYPEAAKKKTGDFYIYNVSKSTMVYQDKPTKLIDGIPYVPVDAIAPAFDTTVSVDGNSVTVKRNATNAVAVYTAGNQTYTLDGRQRQLLYTPKMIDGTLYIAFEDLELGCGISVIYDSYARLAKVTLRV